MANVWRTAFAKDSRHACKRLQIWAQTLPLPKCSAYVLGMDHGKFRKTFSTVRIHRSAFSAKILSVRRDAHGNLIYTVHTRSRAGWPWSKEPIEVLASAFLSDPGWEAD